MEKGLGNCRSFSAVYIDDVLVFSNSWEEHLVHAGRVMEVLREAGLTVKPFKCQWGKRYLDFLGHRIGCGQLAVPEHRAKAMAEFKRPITKTDMMKFLGTIGYYRRYVENFSYHSSLLQ